MSELMIADSGYDAGELACRPLTGLVAGPAAAVVMLAVVAVLQGQEAASQWLRDLGRVVLPASVRTPDAQLIAGTCLHIALGALLGVLYMACQRRGTATGMMIVGAFYGFVAWLVSSLVFFRWIGIGPARFGTWTGLVTMVVFGVALASFASVAQRVSARVDGGIPVD